MLIVETEFVGHSTRLHMRDYDAAIIVAENLFEYSNVAPDTVTVWDFGENNDQNRVVWCKSRRYSEKTIEEIFAELED